MPPETPQEEPQETPLEAAHEAPPGQARRAGRPRSEQADRAIIDAALELFAEAGPAGLCIERVAARAGVGKATIYRRWPGKEDLLLDALAELKTPLPAPKGESVRDDLAALIDAMRAAAVDPRRVRQFAMVLGEGTRYPRLIERYVATVVEPQRELVRAVLRRGVATGELREGANIEVAVDILTGVVLARSRLGQDRADRGYARRVVDELLTGLASR
ncbi:MAG TPA: TetR/AcrR family transcriptional regulator [Streptosporangiaceae bacterium]|nr:TetR/AcrR family transcriptional regulator [Streptosporangiaceae bacterium]